MSADKDHQDETYSGVAEAVTRAPVQFSSAFGAYALETPAPRSLCTDCGVSRTPQASDCGRACQFIRPDYPASEQKAHGRSRDPERGEESHFGVIQSMVRARLKQPAPGAQWTGITTRLGERLLASGQVDAVLTVAPSTDDKWRPVPVLVTNPEGMAKVRGMRMGYAPLLALLGDAREKGYKRLAVIGIPCQVYALRQLEESLGLEALYVIGTPCSDNTLTENFHDFLALLADDPSTITYLEFRADYFVELRFEDGRQKLIPFLKLPISDLPSDFFPLTCRTCVDYTNSLADITVGYMAGDSEQWVIARNNRGTALLALLGDELETKPLTTGGKRSASVQGFIKNTERAAGGLPLRGMPNWVRPLVAWLMPKVGPRGLEFARARVEMKAAETVLHLRRRLPKRMKLMVPDHVWRVLEPYGLEPQQGEQDNSPPPKRLQRVTAKGISPQG